MSQLTTKKSWQDELRRLAEEPDTTSAAVRALEILGKSRGWDKLQQRKAQPQPLPADPIELRRQQLQAVRVQRATAERDGSHVAARQYLVDERELVREIEAMEEQRAQEERDQQDEEARLARFHADLQQLPETMRQKIRAIVLQEVDEA